MKKIPSHGGSIFQDLSLRRQRSLVHMQSSLDRSDPCHQVYVRKGSILHKICGDSIAVNSFHHQSVKRTGDTLRICGVSPDGVIEALESEVFPFVLGLQWHPECMIDRDPSMEKIFFVFAEISRRMKKLQIL